MNSLNTSDSTPRGLRDDTSPCTADDHRFHLAQVICARAITIVKVLAEGSLPMKFGVTGAVQHKVGTVF